MEVTETPACSCPECAKYHGRIYSLFGMDDRFPRFPERLIKTKNLHCGLVMYPFEYGISTPLFSGDLFEMSNRPFVDDRQQEKWQEIDPEKLLDKSTALMRAVSYKGNTAQ